jgi:CO/xanthine dehydrogenase FAD-binding subunit
VGLAGISRSSERKIAFFGIAGKPILIKPKTLDEAKAALPAPAADLYHSAATKLHLAKVLLERAWNSL